MTRRMLIVSPSFHGYHAAIARAFEKLGYDAVTYCYDAVDSTAEKVWNKLRYELPTKLVGGDAHQSADTSSRRAAERVRDVAPDVVLVVRGDTLTEVRICLAKDLRSYVACPEVARASCRRPVEVPPVL